MNRRRFLKSFAAGIAGTHLLGTSLNQAQAADPQHQILTTHGWYIDQSFGGAERAILEAALGNFYGRFLQPYRPLWADGSIMEWNKAGASVTETHMGHYAGGMSAGDVFYDDWLDMWNHFVYFGKPFPPVTLKKNYEPDKFYVAQAYPDQILIYDGAKDESYDGAFKIEINDWYLNNPVNSRIGNASIDPNYWGGVIAHEAWHNLGHLHPGSRDDWDYYLHQMVLHEMCVMQDSHILYGAELPHPVYCRRHPG